jgi:hypothetical protein
MRMIDGFGFGQAWIDAWNRRDVETLVGYFADDATLTTHFNPIASATGRPLLNSYWSALAKSATSFHCTLNDAFWSVPERKLTLLYRIERDGARMRACEMLHFGPDGRVQRDNLVYNALLGSKSPL